MVERWTTQGHLVGSNVLPQEGFVISGEQRKITQGFAVTADDFKVVSIIHLKAGSIEEAVELAKESPTLDLGGAIEVREVKSRSQPKNKNRQDN